jgi:hypothetical protein
VTIIALILVVWLLVSVVVGLTLARVLGEISSARGADGPEAVLRNRRGGTLAVQAPDYRYDDATIDADPSERVGAGAKRARGAGAGGAFARERRR